MDILIMFQKLLENVAVKMKQLWVCGFSNFVNVQSPLLIFLIFVRGT